MHTHQPSESKTSIFKPGCIIFPSADKTAINIFQILECSIWELSPHDDKLPNTRNVYASVECAVGGILGQLYPNSAHFRCEVNLPYKDFTTWGKIESYCRETNSPFAVHSSLQLLLSEGQNRENQKHAVAFIHTHSPTQG